MTTFSAFRGALLLAAASFALVAEPSKAGPFDDGGTAYAKGDYNSALQTLRPLAEAGNANAQMILGFMYHDGQSVPRSNLHAYIWFSLAMSSYDAASQDFQDAGQARDLTAKLMTTADIKRADEMAEQCQAQHYKNCN